MGQVGANPEALLGDVLLWHWEQTHKATEAENARIRPGFSGQFLFLLAFEVLYVLYRLGLTVLKKTTGLFSAYVANSFKKILLTGKQK